MNEEIVQNGDREKGRVIDDFPERLCHFRSMFYVTLTASARQSREMLLSKFPRLCDAATKD